MQRNETDRVYTISIHAPARGASIADLDMQLDYLLFQFTPLREGLRMINIIGQPRDAFQFTPLREGLRKFSSVTLACNIFQFTPLREGLHKPIVACCISSRFQFTPLREGLQ